MTDDEHMKETIRSMISTAMRDILWMNMERRTFIDADGESYQVSVLDEGGVYSAIEKFSTTCDL